MITILKELWCQYKIRKLRGSISKLTERRRKLNDLQKELTKRTEEYLAKHESLKKS